MIVSVLFGSSVLLDICVGYGDPCVWDPSSRLAACFAPVDDRHSTVKRRSANKMKWSQLVLRDFLKGPRRSFECLFGFRKVKAS